MAFPRSARRRLECVLTLLFCTSGSAREWFGFKLFPRNAKSAQPRLSESFVLGVIYRRDSGWDNDFTKRKAQPHRSPPAFSERPSPCGRAPCPRSLSRALPSAHARSRRASAAHPAPILRGSSAFTHLAAARIPYLFVSVATGALRRQPTGRGSPFPIRQAPSRARSH